MLIKNILNSYFSKLFSSISKNKIQCLNKKVSNHSNRPVCSSVSSCLMLNTSEILMSSLSSLINAIFIIVCQVDVFL